MPVLLPEVINNLKVTGGSKYIDATIGSGGYSWEILKRGGIVLGIDQDEDALEYTKRRSIYGKNKLILIKGNFADLKSIAIKYGFEEVSGIIFDLGLSSHQLDSSGRGFSFRRDEHLDMRMDKEAKITAADILNNYTLEQLYEIFIKFSEELNSRTIATAIVRTRSLKGNILRTKDLATIISEVLRKAYLKAAPSVFNRIVNGSIARIFQSLRIEVNNELSNLEKGLEKAVGLLLPNGRLAVLSYHSLEDRLVKMQFINAEETGKFKIITKKPIISTEAEREINPRSHCAKLRIAEKLLCR